MTPHPDNNRQLEQWIDEAMRGLPLRSAPASLEERVLAEIARRAALPWWRKSFAHWPIAARAGFILLCGGIVQVALMAAGWMTAGMDPAPYREALAQPVAWLESTRTVVHAITGFVQLVLRHIPPLWLYGGLAFVAIMYFAVIGLGAAAFKALRTPSSASSL